MRKIFVLMICVLVLLCSCKNEQEEPSPVVVEELPSQTEETQAEPSTGTLIEIDENLWMIITDSEYILVYSGEEPLSFVSYDGRVFTIK